MKEYLKTIAELMAVAARTAPKAAGQDFVKLEIVEGDKLSKLADAMLAYGAKTGKKNFDRDGKNISDSAAVLLVGLKDAKTVGLNCGACGFKECKELTAAKEGPEFKGPHCAYRLLDLGIALGSAVKTAGILNADNRIIYRVGVLARQMKLIDADLVIGIPISATGKSIYFDR
ncbi:MAG: hypothetical protein HY811_03425 [Planctomycetes bacterium]|nr:hypothetical protein [Planctomycetota bacterium]